MRVRSIRSRLVAGMLLLVSASVGIVAAVLLARQADALLETQRSRAEVQALVLAESVAAPILFDDPAAAESALAALERDPTVLRGRLSTADGRPFAGYDREPGDEAASLASSAAAAELVAAPVRLDGEELGRLEVLVDTGPVRERIRRQTLTAGVLLAGMLGLVLVVALRISSLLVAPVRDLAATADRVRTSDDWGIRAEVPRVIEIARLVEVFNRMLGEIEARGGELEDARRTLERRVDERTAELREAVRLLEDARRRAEAANEAKSAFLANMSHELRTPMTAILGFIDLVNDDDLPVSERRVAAETIRRNGEHLLALLNDILDLSKIEAGRLEVERIEVDPVALLDDVHGLMQVRAAAKGIDLRIELGGPLPERVETDPVRVRQVLVNLVGNAIKFTEHGGVTVRLAATGESGRTRLRVEVHDTGIGIDEEFRRRLFRPFSQADASMSRRFGGTGLGLAISRRLVELMDGWIDVESEPGRGSVFRFEIDGGPARPLFRRRRDEPPPDDAGAGPSGDPDRPLAGRRVLLVEDGPDNRRLIRFHLVRGGADVTTAEHGGEGVEQVEAAERGGRPFDVVLMDMQMPVLDGYAATTRLRDAGCPTPILALTAHAMQGDRERCLAAGCDDYLTKPVDPAALVAACDRWAIRGASRRANEDAPPAPDAAGERGA